MPESELELFTVVGLELLEAAEDGLVWCLLWLTGTPAPPLGCLAFTVTVAYTVVVTVAAGGQLEAVGAGAT